MPSAVSKYSLDNVPMKETSKKRVLDYTEDITSPRFGAELGETGYLAMNSPIFGISATLDSFDPEVKSVHAVQNWYSFFVNCLAGPYNRRCKL